MSIFGKKPKVHLGIDFGAGGIKVLQLQKRDGRALLYTYGFSEIAPEEMGVNYIDNIEAAGTLLKHICEKAKTTTVHAVAALPIPAVFSAVLSLAAVPKKELAQAVEWEAKKLIPFPLKDVTLDFKELKFSPEKADRKDGKDQTKESKSIEILLTAAPKGIIDKYLAIAKVAGITLSSIETEAFAIIRSVVGNDPTPTVLIDIGAVRSNILFVDGGIPMLTRSVEIGGKKCTEIIASTLGITLADAESLKRDLGVKPLPGTVAGTLPTLLQETLTPLINELHYSFNVYKTRTTIARPPERIILIGGGAGLPGLADMLSKEFALRTFLGNPWERVDVHPDLKGLVNSFGSRFAVAIGLALRNM